MSELTSIQWTMRTWSPWLGCSKVSPGCKNCYIVLSPALLFRGLKHGEPRQRTSESYWKQPLAWNKKPFQCPHCKKWYATDMCGACDWCGFEATPIKVFPSLCDWLDDEVPIEWLEDFLILVRKTPNLIWQLLTKRTENWYSRLTEANYGLTRKCQDTAHMVVKWLTGSEAPSNIWFGFSAENDEMFKKRYHEAKKIPAVVTFCSAEPLLGPIDFMAQREDEEVAHSLLLDWVIFGGESHRNREMARVCQIEHIRDGLRQLRAAKVNAYVKQLGSRPVQDLSAVIPEASDEETQEDPMAAAQWDIHRHQCPMHLKDPKGGSMEEWPEDLRVREMPSV